MAVHRQLNACTMIVVDKYHGITRLTAEGGTHNVPGFFLKYMQYIMMANIMIPTGATCCIVLIIVLCCLSVIGIINSVFSAFQCIMS